MLTVNHKHCTGCGSCIEACPQLAVVKIRDKYKFIYPSIDKEQCTFCGKCVEVCPLDKPVASPSPDFVTTFYAAKAQDKQTLLDSHAGGIFPLLAKAVLDEGGVVYGCAFDENRHPRHLRIDNPADLVGLQGLKPVQSDTDGIYTQVKQDVESGTTVLFSGTPCQCDGLRHFLGRNYPRLLVVDMLCSGVTSEGIFNRYVNWLEGKLGGKIRDLRFENKRAFGHSRSMRVLFRRGKFRYLLSLPAAWDSLYTMHREGYLHRRSCGVCRYASPVRVGDISLGHFEQIRRAHPDFPYDNGASLVVISSAKGAEWFGKIAGQIDCEESDFARASANRRLTAPLRENKHRAELLTEIYRHGFVKAADRFGKPGFLTAASALIRSAMPDRAVIGFDKAVRQCKAFVSQRLSHEKEPST